MGGLLGPLAWDTHYKNLETVKELSPVLDSAWATLLNDLKVRGLLESTLIVWMGEFGRSPKDDEGTGSDHYPNAWSTVLAGGGLHGGQICREDERGRDVGRGTPRVRPRFAGDRLPCSGHRSSETEYLQRRQADSHRRQGCQAGSRKSYRDSSVVRTRLRPPNICVLLATSYAIVPAVGSPPKTGTMQLQRFDQFGDLLPEGAARMGTTLFEPARQ